MEDSLDSGQLAELQHILLGTQTDSFPEDVGSHVLGSEPTDGLDRKPSSSGKQPSYQREYSQNDVPSLSQGANEQHDVIMATKIHPFVPQAASTARMLNLSGPSNHGVAYLDMSPIGKASLSQRMESSLVGFTTGSPELSQFFDHTQANKTPTPHNTQFHLTQDPQGPIRQVSSKEPASASSGHATSLAQEGKEGLHPSPSLQTSSSSPQNVAITPHFSSPSRSSTPQRGRRLSWPSQDSPVRQSSLSRAHAYFRTLRQQEDTVPSFPDPKDVLIIGGRIIYDSWTDSQGNRVVEPSRIKPVKKQKKMSWKEERDKSSKGRRMIFESDSESDDTSDEIMITQECQGDNSGERTNVRRASSAPGDLENQSQALQLQDSIQTFLPNSQPEISAENGKKDFSTVIVNETGLKSTPNPTWKVGRVDEKNNAELSTWDGSPENAINQSIYGGQTPYPVTEKASRQRKPVIPSSTQGTYRRSQKQFDRLLDEIEPEVLDTPMIMAKKSNPNGSRRMKTLIGSVPETSPVPDTPLRTRGFAEEEIEEDELFETSRERITDDSGTIADCVIVRSANRDHERKGTRPENYKPVFNNFRRKQNLNEQVIQNDKNEVLEIRKRKAREVEEKANLMSFDSKEIASDDELKTSASNTGNTVEGHGFISDIKRQRLLSKDLNILPSIASTVEIPFSSTSNVDTSTFNMEIATHRVFAIFRDSKNYYYPATVIEPSSCSSDPESMIAVRFDDGLETEVKLCHIRRLEFRKGDLFKTAMQGYKRHIYSVDHMEATPKRQDGKTDIEGNNIVVGKRKDSDNEVRVDVEMVYLTPALFTHFKNRKYEFVNGMVRNKRLTDIVTSPAKRSRGASVGCSSRAVSLSPRNSHRMNARVMGYLFEGMAFAITLSNDGPYSRDELTRKIQLNSGLVLEDGLHELFLPAEEGFEKRLEGYSELKVKGAGGLRFLAVVSDGYSRKGKFLQALALGVPCLAARFIDTCVKLNRIVDWTPYLLPAGDSETLGLKSMIVLPFDDSICLADRFAQRKLPLDGCRVLLVVGKGKKQEDSKRQYIFLLYAMGAVLVERAYSIDETANLIRQNEEGSWNLIIVNQTEEEKVEKALQTGMGVKARPAIKTFEFIVQSLILGVLADEI